MAQTPFGPFETQFFYELTPERILSAVEALGLRCTGNWLALNSMENRVCQVEIEIEDTAKLKSPSERYRIVKFYRPGRWSKEQILEEHQFLIDLVECEIPAVAPLKFPDGTTLMKLDGLEIWYTVFPKIGGRSPDELDLEQAERVGRLLGRIHSVGASRKSEHRIALTLDSYGRDNLRYLLESKSIPAHYLERYSSLVEEICKLSEPLFKPIAPQRIHGDCHRGNLVWNDSGPFWVDFDDMVVGPPVQDLWLMIPGRDQESLNLMEAMLEGYEQMYHFDRRSLKLVEPLRALRFIHFSAWIAKRWHDPAFPRYFPQFGTERYWAEQVQDLTDQLEFIRNIDSSPGFNG